MLNKSSLNNQHVPPNTCRPLQCIHTASSISSLSPAVCRPHHDNIRHLAAKLWWWHYLLRSFSGTQLPAVERQDFCSSNNLASTYSFDLFSHSSSVSNLKEWAAPHMLPVSTSLFLLFFLLAPPHLFPCASVLALRHISKSLLPSLPRTSISRQMDLKVLINLLRT